MGVVKYKSYAFFMKHCLLCFKERVYGLYLTITLEAMGAKPPAAGQVLVIFLKK